jgi:DNA glycosylase AlkZ-like
MSNAVLQLSAGQVRSFRILAQGLPPAPGAQFIPTLQRTGFLRTLGGGDVYLGARARVPDLCRAGLDAAVTRADVQVVPAVRGCIYLVSRRDVPLCLRVASLLSRARDQRDAEKAGIRPGEIDDVAAAALALLQRQGPLTTDALRRALPEGTVRSLGEQGRKVGVASPLPLALRQLEFAGLVERTLPGGRLDSERYAWNATAQNPFTAAKLPESPAALHGLLLERFLQAAGVATLKAFCSWSGLPQRDATAALPHADVVPVEIEGIRAFASPETTPLQAHLGDADNAVALLPFEDNLLHLAGGPGHLVDPSFHELQVPNWGSSKQVSLGKASHVAFRGVLADGRLCGFWEYDPDAGTAVTWCFQKPSRDAVRRIAEVAAATGAFLREELGHGHTFSLDTDDELRRRVRELRKLLPGGRSAAKSLSSPGRARKTAAAPRRPAEETPTAPRKVQPAGAKRASGRKQV